MQGWQTSAVQRTLEPLKSWLSNFSTAVFKSAAVSNSTKLRHISEALMLHDRFLPFAVTVTSNLRVYHVEAGAAGKVFQVLWPQVSPSPVQTDHSAQRSIPSRKFVSLKSAIQNQTTSRCRHRRMRWMHVRHKTLSSWCKSKWRGLTHKILDQGDSKMYVALRVAERAWRELKKEPYV